MGLDTFAPVPQWQPEMKGSLPGVALSTTVASGRFFVPSAHRGGMDDQRRDACRRVSFGHSLSQSVVGPAGSKVVDVIIAERVIDIKCVPGEFTLERLFCLAFCDVLTIGDGDDAVVVNDSSNAGVTLSPTSGPDFSFFVNGYLFGANGCHFGPPLVC